MTLEDVEARLTEWIDEFSRPGSNAWACQLTDEFRRMRTAISAARRGHRKELREAKEQPEFWLP